MAVRSGFWNSSGSDIRRYYNSDFSHLISLLINDGVSQNYGESLIPTTGNGMTIVIQTGEAWFNDIWLRNDADLVIDIDSAPIVNEYSRLDAIAIKIDASSGVRDGTIVYMAGTPTAGTPTLPEMVDTADVHWHLLASVLVKTGDTSIPGERITNYVGSNTTPLITGLLETVSTEDLIQQWQAEFNSWNSSKQAEFEAWVETIQGILDEEAAGHLQLEIEDLYSKTHTNLLNPTLGTTTVNGVTCTANGDGTYTLNGTASSNTFFHIVPLMELEVGKKYKLCGCPSGGADQVFKLAIYRKSTSVQMRMDIGEGAQFTADESEVDVSIVIYKNQTVPTNLTFKPMLTTDLSATYDDFVQYSGDGELNQNVAEIYGVVGKLQSHIGMIIQSTTLDTEAKVKAIYGGTSWNKIEGRFLLGASSSYGVGTTGGSATHTMTTSEMPTHAHGLNSHTHGLNNHTHSIPALSGTAASAGAHHHNSKGKEVLAEAGEPWANTGTASGVIYRTLLQDAMYDGGDHTHSVTTNASTTGGNSGSTAAASGNTTTTGGGKAMDIMNPYKAVYIWERIA